MRFADPPRTHLARAGFGLPLQSSRQQARCPRAEGRLETGSQLPDYSPLNRPPCWFLPESRKAQAPWTRFLGGARSIKKKRIVLRRNRASPPRMRRRKSAPSASPGEGSRLVPPRAYCRRRRMQSPQTACRVEPADSVRALPCARHLLRRAAATTCWRLSLPMRIHVGEGAFVVQIHSPRAGFPCNLGHTNSVEPNPEVVRMTCVRGQDLLLPSTGPGSPPGCLPARGFLFL